MPSINKQKRTFIRIVLELLENGYKPTPKRLNVLMNRTDRQNLSAWECKCRVHLMQIFGYTLQPNGRWEIV